jgi:hypothetical protein
MFKSMFLLCLCCKGLSRIISSRETAHRRIMGAVNYPFENTKEVLVLIFAFEAFYYAIR